MTSHTTSTPRPELARSVTWPVDTMQARDTSPETEAFKDDLEQHPERHFLSPMTPEESCNWDSDSDDEDDGGEWNAGIMDFSLFSADRKRAMETGQPLDTIWDSFVSNQAEALKRSVERVMKAESEDVPALTPDTSPRMKDDLDDEGELEGMGRKMVMPQIQVPNYLTIEVKPAGVDGTNNSSPSIFGPDDYLPLSLAQINNIKKKRVQRPGLRHARTLSGRKHAWRRPGEEMFTVGEDVYGEEEAEMEEREEQSVFRLVVEELELSS